MAERKQPRQRRAVFVTLGTAALGTALVLATVVAMKAPNGDDARRSLSSSRALRPVDSGRLKVTAPARETLTLTTRAAPIPTPAASHTQNAPGAVSASALVASTLAPSAPMPPLPAVDGNEYVRELAQAGGLTQHERDRVRTFLGLIAHAQEQVNRVVDVARRADLERRLQQQTLNGIQIRLAAEKRTPVMALLQRGVPPLSFEEPQRP